MLKEVLSIEAKYALENNMVVQFDKNHIPQIEYETKNGKHSYWSF